MSRYAGIGSRNTPSNFKSLIIDISYFLGISGLTLRSGGAPGADSFFEEGCDIAKGSKEIWLPHLRFNRNLSTLLPSKDAFDMASKVVGHWKHCNDFAKKAHARNCHQVLGFDLKTPVDFVICWTTNGEKKGGTATALEIAERMSIPILNLGKFKDPDSESTLQSIDDFLKTCSFVRVL